MRPNNDLLNNWINKKLKEISEKLPTLVHSDPASFSCGYNMGYKQALMDLVDIVDLKTKYGVLINIEKQIPS